MHPTFLRSGAARWAALLCLSAAACTTAAPTPDPTPEVAQVAPPLPAEPPKEEPPPAEPPAEPVPPAPPAALRFTETAIPVGKWPEGVVQSPVNPEEAWVAESGKRQVAQVSLTSGKVLRRVKVGRLPVEIVAQAEQLVTLVRTDSTVLNIQPKTGKTRALARTPDCPEHMTQGEGALWVLLWDGCSSAGSTVLRVDPATGATRRSADQGKNAWKVAAGFGRLWIGLGSTGIAVLNAETLEREALIEDPGYHQTLLLGARALYLDTLDGVARIDPGDLSVRRAAGLGQLMAMTQLPDGQLAAINREGSLFFLDPDTLALQGTYTLAAPGFNPQEMIALPDGSLLLTTYTTAPGVKGEGGTLWRLAPAR